MEIVEEQSLILRIPLLKKRIKHIEICYHYICEQLEKGTVKVYAVSPSENTADIFTKNLGPILFLKHRQALGLEFYPLNREFTQTSMCKID